MEIGIIFEGNARMVSAIEFKRYVTGIRILEIVAFQFNCKQKPCQVILLAIDECLAIYLYHTILSLYLPISQKIKSYKQFTLYAKEVA